MPSTFLDVDPRTLRLPHELSAGADPLKLARQIARFGKSTRGMLPPWVTRCKDGLLMLNNGATRAARVAKLLPGQALRVEIIEEWPNHDISHLRTIGDTLP